MNDEAKQFFKTEVGAELALQILLIAEKPVSLENLMEKLEARGYIIKREGGEKA